jgi:MoaA/NifB/PqqE/SkfB family radical SAM enzyme
MAMTARNRNPLRAIATWWELQRMPMLDWIQVEITTRCNASCGYCPRTIYGEHWSGGDLSTDRFRALEPFFATTRLVHLQGWGEPLLHRDFFDLIGLVKKAGCRVSTATNGMLLDRETAHRLVASGIDDVAFSLAGIGAKNDEIRRGTKFEAILQAIGWIQSAKRDLRSETPAVNVAYMLLRSQVSALPEIVPVLAGRGIENIIVSTLDFVPSKDLGCERITPVSEAEYLEWKSRLDGLVEEGKRAGLSIQTRLACPGRKNRMCTENVGRALVVCADGAVAPCVYTNVPAAGTSQDVTGCEDACERLTFGNLSEVSLPSIWRNERYASFRRSFRKTPHPRCRGCSKLTLA